MRTVQFLIFASSYLLKVVLFNLAFLVFVIASDFSTDLFVNQVDMASFAYCFVVVNLVSLLFYRGFVLRGETVAGPSRLGRDVNLGVAFILLALLVGSFVALEQKVLSLSSSAALLALAANSPAIALFATTVFVAGIPQALALDEYIPIIFCALLNVLVFVPWLLEKGRTVFYALCVAAFGLVSGLAYYYVTERYNPFKLVERVFEQAAPISWEGSPLLWFQPRAIIAGMPDERELMAMDGTWDAQFKMTYLIVNSPVLGAIFLAVFAYLLGRFAAGTFESCGRRNPNVAKNFLKLKLLVILVEVLGEKVFDVEKIAAYIALIALIEFFEAAWSGRPPRKHRAPAIA